METIYDIIEQNGLEEVASIDSAEMYSWSMTVIYFQRSSGRFFGLSGSGCSCNWFGDGINSLSDFDELTRDRAIERLREEAGSAYEALAADDVQREIAKVRDFR